jgi:hypothetical protein
MQRHGVDATGNIMEMITMLQGYWDIASRRLIDNVCMLVERDFVEALLTEVDTQAALFGMALSSTDIRELMKEDMHLIERRKAIKARIQLIQSSLDVLMQHIC